MSKENPDQEFLSILHRLEPASVQELCEATGVTATAVRQRLVRLQLQGLLSRRTVRQDRGRPHHAYALTQQGVKSLGDDQSEMATLLWREISRIDEPAVKNRVLAGVKSALIQRFNIGAPSENLVERMEKLCSTLSEFGFDVECLPAMEDETVDGSHPHLPVLREYNCPYHDLAVEDASFCELEQSVFSEILGSPVELSACRLEGHRCCEFQVGVADQI